MRDAESLYTGKSLSSAACDYNVYALSVKDRLREGFKGIALSAAASYSFYRSLPMFMILAPAAFILFPLIRRPQLKRKRLWELKLQFKEAIWILSGFLSAGMSVENAFVMSVPELKKLYGDDAMIVKEFQLITGGIGLNKPVEGLIADFAARSGLDEIRSFAEVFAIARRSGGSLREIIERTGRIIREETEVSEEINNLTASRRYEQRIMNILPFGIIVYVNLTSGGFMNVMYESITGRLIMSLCLGLTVLSYWLSDRILDIRI